MGKLKGMNAKFIGYQKDERPTGLEDVIDVKALTAFYKYNTQFEVMPKSNINCIAFVNIIDPDANITLPSNPIEGTFVRVYNYNNSYDLTVTGSIHGGPGIYTVPIYESILFVFVESQWHVQRS